MQKNCSWQAVALVLFNKCLKLRQLSSSQLLKFKRFIDDFDDPATRGYNRGSKKAKKEKAKNEYEIVDSYTNDTEPICISSDESSDVSPGSAGVSNNGHEEQPPFAESANGRYFERNATKTKSTEAKGQTQTKGEDKATIIIEEENSTVDEGIGSSDKKITIDLTGDQDEAESDDEMIKSSGQCNHPLESLSPVKCQKRYP